MLLRHALPTLLATALGASAALAQSDVQLPFLYGAPATVANPARLQDHRVTVSLPSFAIDFSSPYAIDAIGEVRDGTLYLDAERLEVAIAEADRGPGVDARVETFGFNYRDPRGWQIGIAHATRVHSRTLLPPDFIRLATRGNGAFIGETLEVAPTIAAQAYQEFTLRGAYALTDALVIGVAAKYLSGSGALSAEDNSLTVFTDDDIYRATVTSDATVYSAGVPVSFEGLGFAVGDIERPLGAGTGFAVDFGAVWRPREDLEFGLAVRDLGSVSWSGGDAREHRSEGSFTFAGYEGSLFTDEGPFDFGALALLDSLSSAIEFESSPGSFRTTLPATVQATARYSLGARTSANAAVYATQTDAWRAGFGVGITQGFGRFGQVGVLGGARAGGGYLGANLAVDLWGPQFYVACDNLLTAFSPMSGRNAHLRAGVNLAFGAISKHRKRTVTGFYDTKVEGINK